ncbi:acetyl-CoA acetyltransferase [Parvibaculum sp.]|uniref:acetyl-CoA acetyltransferase n=1 Tax=Parvibaculum sp. TaxID=2024848 RepID=UPI000C98E1B5|nr:acetyl-CoA acetyltransferase [Parvibaculum sp.]MAB15229.1 acetyl-CoA acetyltransferase [Parvibaculum sp.]
MSDVKLDDRMPVLVGCGQNVQKEKDVEKAKSPMHLMADAAEAAAADTGLGKKLWDVVDTVTCVRFITDSPDSARLPFGRYPNAAKTLSNLIGANPAKTCYGPTGGNTPQYLVNYTAEQIAQGETDIALVAGSECFATMMRALGQGKVLDWHDENPGQDRIDIGNEKAGVTETEKRHKLQYPVNIYPMFENAIRGQQGRTVEEHKLAVGKLMAPFTKVAAQHPQAWFPVERTPEEIATVTDANRYIGFPYTKYMNAIMQVDQAAAVVMMSVGKARELGIPQEKWVFLHGCGDANDLWFPTERVNYYTSPAIKKMGEKAFGMAGWDISQIDYIDLYSCFPSAVQIGRDALGIAEDDPRELTVTGGLPYFGGAGNNYVMHSIATMMDKLRAKPGTKGLCTSNGWYVTKHGMGLYSTLPKEGKWEREAPATYQAEIDAEKHPVVDETPNGKAKIETYTVVHGRDGPDFAIVFGRLDDTDARFVAHTPNDPATLKDMVERDQLGRPGTVVADPEGVNIFTPE